VEIFSRWLYTFSCLRYRETTPVRQLEAIPEGAGIVLDDIAAGLYALIVMHLFLHFGLLK